MQLTKNFNLTELTFSPTAITKGIDQTPSDEVIKNLLALSINVLQPLRDFMAESIKISSGYRSFELNKSIGGANSSQHCHGEAADLICSDRNHEMFKFIRKSLVFDQLIWEFGDDNNPNWVHVSFSRTHNRKQCLKATKHNGSTKYTAI